MGSPLSARISSVQIVNQEEESTELYDYMTCLIDMYVTRGFLGG